MAGQGWATSFSKAAQGFYQLPAVRQLSLLFGLSVSVALGVAVVLWSQAPDYRTLFAHLDARSSSEVTHVLEQFSVPYHLDVASGAVLVPSVKLNIARIKLAQAGLPKKRAQGFDGLSRMQNIGASRLVETARYWHALETELARTISSFDNVRSARVHLAANKSSVLINDIRKPTASVLIDLSTGARLEKEQVDAIEQLVAASVQGLSSKVVTVVDSQGRLLSDHSGNMSRTRAEFDYQHSLENSYAKHIEDILTPMFGANKVRAQVAADIDFTSIEKTQEEYNPLNSAIRSENTLNVKSVGAKKGEFGVPGDLITPQGVIKTPLNNDNNSSKIQTTRNFEISRNISHTRQPIGAIRRLTVAVIVDDHTHTDAVTGVVRHTKLNEEELNKITLLVKNVVGYSQARGDMVSVVNTSFAEPLVLAPLLQPEIWEQSWFWLVVKSVVAGLFILLLVLMVLRPVLTNLARKVDDNEQYMSPPANPADGAAADSQITISTAELNRLRQQGEWTKLKKMASDDPQRIAQVMRTWVGDE